MEGFVIIGIIGYFFICIMFSGGFDDLLNRRSEIIKNQKKWEDKRDES